MQRLLVLFGIMALAVAAPGATAVPSYQAKVVTQSERAFHPPFTNDTFWLGDYIWLYFRDPRLSDGLLRTYRVCWTYESFKASGCKTAVASRMWAASPPRIQNAYNDNMRITWSVQGKVVLSKRLRITAE